MIYTHFSHWLFFLKPTGQPTADVGKVNSRIALKPTVLALRNAFPVGTRGSCGGRRIHAYQMMKEFGIDLPQTIRFYDAEIDDDGIMVLDLRTARVPKKSPQPPAKPKAESRDRYVAGMRSNSVNPAVRFQPTDAMM